jgi:hypothetical protein
METEGSRAGPSAAVAELTAAAEPELPDRRSTAAHPPWVRPIADYERRMTGEIHGARYVKASSITPIRRSSSHRGCIGSQIC